MTALTVPARPAEHALRPVPWRRMAWVTWRQHRIAVGGVVVFLGAVAVVLWIVGLRLHHAYAVAVACRPSGSPVCDAAVTSFATVGGPLTNGGLLQAVPALIGAFAGAPVLARELESGTFRYAWTQGFGRWRWALAKLVPLAVVVAAAAGALSVLLSWYYQPYLGARNAALFLPADSPLSAGVFGMRGITFAAWTLAAFAIGGLAGMLIRRVVPAIVATLAVYAGLAFATGLYLREHYLAPLVARNFFNPPASTLLVRQWWTHGGVPVSQARIYQAFNSLFFRLMPTGKGGDVKAEKMATYLGVERHLTRQGWTLLTRYQPASRFWPFQGIEAGWLLALSALLIAATVWLVRRRAT